MINILSKLETEGGLPQLNEKHLPEALWLASCLGWEAWGFLISDMARVPSLFTPFHIMAVPMYAVRQEKERGKKQHTG